MSQLLTQGLLSAKLLIKGMFGRTSAEIVYPISGVLVESLTSGVLTESKISGTLLESKVTGVIS